MSTPQDWREARAALGGGRWSDAAARFSSLAAATDAPEAHDGLAQAAWWLDDADTTLGSREAAYRAFRAAGRELGAAAAAATLGYDSILFGRGVAVGRGWLARASDLLAGTSGSSEAGWLAVRRAEVALNVDHDATAALAHAVSAQDVGHAREDDDLLIVGQALAGLAHVRLGAVADGMTMLESAAAAATAGDVRDLMWLGKICCWLISACQETHDLAGAEHWCARVREICERRDLAPLSSVCQTQYASVLLAGGRAREAEVALLGVMSDLEHSQRASRLHAVACLGELRRRQGRVVEAEDLLRQAGDVPAAVVSLAWLRLDDGDAARARSMAAQVLRWLPPGQAHEQVDALVVTVASCVEQGDLAAARESVAALRRIADLVDTPALRAHAHAAGARVADVEAPADRATVVRWQDAVREFRLADLAFDEADALVGLAAALRRTGDARAADEHETAARSALAPLHAGDGGQPDGVLTRRQVEVIVLLAQGLSNQGIAEHLHLSEHTVHRHVANIYTAIGVGSRAAAAAYAVAHGLH